MTQLGATTAGASPPIAIVGMSVLLPGAADLTSYWENLVNAVDSITEVPEQRWDPCFYDADAASGPARADAIYCRRGGFVDGLAEFDPIEFGIMPGSVSATEPDQLIALRVAAAAIADAGGAERLPRRERIGVILGRGGYLTPGLVRLDQRVRTAHQLVRTLGELVPGIGSEQLDRVRAAFAEQLEPHDPASAIGLVPNLAASRIANRLDLRGPAYTVDAACASALIAVDQAVGELARGRCDAVLAGGVHHCHDVTFWSVFAQLRALSPSQCIRPFHRAADGLLIGEGTGVVVLKRLADAERDGDRIYAVIRGTGIASDGRGASLFHPEPDGQVLALRRAWQAAGLDPAEPGSLGLLEAHGTATPAGDQAELATLERVFGRSAARGDAVIGSVKSMIGHTMPAAGIAGLVKVALATHRGVLLPTLHCEDPHPALARTRFRPLRSAQPWELSEGQAVRRAAVNAFGFGGINAHVVLEQHVPPTPVPIRGSRAAVVSEPEQVLLLSAASAAGIAELLERDDAAVRAIADADCTTDGCRLGIVAPTAKRLALARKVVARGTAWRGRNDVWFSPQPLLLARERAQIGFVFPGAESEFEPRVDDVAARLGLPRPDVSADGICRQAAAVISVGRLLDRALRRLRIVPDTVAGHSIGEWAAMISAGIYAEAEVDRFLEDLDPEALRLPDAVFAAIGCGVDRVADAIAVRPEIVISHDNSPNQSIVCGPSDAVGELVGWFRRRNVLGQVLPFRSGFHTPSLRPYLAPVREAADQFRLHPPSVPIWSATLAALYPADEATVRELFVRHLVEPVRFRPLVEAMYDVGVRVFVQVGTGQLSALIADTLRGKEHLAVAANTPHRGGLDQLRCVVTALWTEGGSAQPTVDLFAGPRPSLRRPPVKLDLSAGLVSLDGAAPQIDGLASNGQQPALTPPLTTSLSGLEQLTMRSPLMEDLRGLLQETADSASAVVAAVARSESVAAPEQTVLRVSLQAMPYLRDHCGCRQREDWPDDSDRWPIVPATTLIEHMLDAAQRIAPGRQPIAVHGAQLNRWVVAAPPLDVTVSALREGRDRVRVTVGEHAQAVIELADRFRLDAPRPWPLHAETEWTPEITAKHVYAKRWVFHGPQFQGITDLTAMGEKHVRGVITTPAAPGALLDNAGQLLGVWMMSTHRNRQVVFPVGIRQLRFFGPHPAAGTEVQCTVRIRSVTDALLEADVQLVHRGRVWAQIEGWQDRRFDIDVSVGRSPETTALSGFRPGGRAVLFDRWPDIASRDLIVRGQLSAPERADHDRCAPRTRRRWLLGRIALKDAVRRSLWDGGYGPLFPAELRVLNDDSGAPRVVGRHGATLPQLDVSLAHCGEVAVAIARPRATRGGGVGIDVEQIKERDDSTRDVALSSQETALLVAGCAQTGEPSAIWFTRFWAAKEAVAKAEGTGLGGLPKRFEVVAASPTELAVRVRRRERGRGSVRYRVCCEPLSNPPYLEQRQYVIAWTAGAEHEQEEMR